MSILNRKIAMLNPGRRRLRRRLLKIPALCNRVSQGGMTAKCFRNLAPGWRDCPYAEYVLQGRSELDDAVADLSKIPLDTFCILKIAQLANHGAYLGSA